MTIKFETIPVAELEKRKLEPDQSPTLPVVLVVDDDQAVGRFSRHDSERVGLCG